MGGFGGTDPFFPDPGTVGGCDPLFDPADCGSGGGVTVYNPVTIIIDTGVAADLAGVATALFSVGSILDALKGWLGGLIKLLAGIISLISAIWGNVLKPALQAIQKAIKWIHDKLAPILKKISDMQKAQRKMLLDLYNKFIRPIIQVIETVRRIIHLLDLLHIHIFDALDKVLARIEGKILTPFYRALYRINTLGGLFGYMLNSYGLIFRSLYLATMTANRGGAFSILFKSPAYGFTPIAPGVPTAGLGAGVSLSTFQTAYAPAFQTALAAASSGQPASMFAPLTSGVSTPEFDAAVALLNQQLQASLTAPA